MAARALTSVLALALLAAAPACMTYDTRTNLSYDGPRIYSGSRTDLEGMRLGFMSFNLPIIGFYLVDLPFSLVADTVLLPVTVPEQRARAAAEREAARTDVEVSGPVTPLSGETEKDALANAHRLFEACITLLERLDPDIRSCYSRTARIAHGDREYTGAEFKTEVAGIFRRLQEQRGFATYRNATYQPRAGGGVRVDAMLAASFLTQHAPTSFVLAPGEDGHWRIVEEIGPAWP